MMENINFEELGSNYLIPWGINLLMAILIFIIGRMIAKILVRLLRKILVRAEMDKILINFIASITKTALLLFVIIASIDQLGVDTTSLIAVLGAAGLAVGLALQGSLQNFASGVLLIVFRPFREGDFIEAAGISGVVEHITIFNTILRTGDNREMIVPNGEIYKGTIINYSARDTRRIDMVFGIGYDDDINKARKIINDILERDARILKDPAALIAVSELADSSVNFVVRPWVNSGDYWPVRFALTEQIKLAFDESGISIPYPQMDVHLDKVQ
jgi:small conductance mechanosensitive channel